MRIYLTDRNIKYADNNRVVCFENDSDVVEFVCIVEDSKAQPEDWLYKLDIESKVNGEPFYNTISLKKSEFGYRALLTAGSLPRGKSIAQIRRIAENKTYVSECFELWVKKSILGHCTAYQEKQFIPSEFYQIEQNLDNINNNPPIPDETGFWKIWSNEIGDYVITDIPVAGGGSEYTAGNGIDITNEIISAKVDNNTITLNDDNELTVSITGIVKVDNNSIIFNGNNELTVSIIDAGEIV